MPLGGLREFQERPTLASLLPTLDELMALEAALKAEHGQPIYFPFYRYGGTQIRTQQAYFVKFPRELFEFIPEIASVRIDADVEMEDADVPEDFQPRRKVAPAGRTTRVQDPKLRAAIERRAVDVALGYYSGIGGTDAKELGKPYDLAVKVNGVERHCEVKGSSMLIDCVELTINEVSHGKECASVDLIVVDGIEIRRDKLTGDISATGGRMRVWTDWSPSDADLAARRFAYTLPVCTPVDRG
ncbi:MAG: DUF3883 domain-containing protein [Dehalococcoidia bacterium]